MSILNQFFGKKQSEASDDDLNAILIPIRDRICDFQESNNVAWTVLIPAAQKEALRIAVHLHGISGARVFFSDPNFKKYTNNDIPISAIMNISVPPAPIEHIQVAEKLMFKLSSIMIEKKYPAENVAKAFFYFALIVGSKVVNNIYASLILKATFEELNYIEGRIEP